MHEFLSAPRAPSQHGNVGRQIGPLITQVRKETNERRGVLRPLPETPTRPPGIRCRPDGACLETRLSFGDGARVLQTRSVDRREGGRWIEQIQRRAADPPRSAHRKWRARVPSPGWAHQGCPRTNQTPRTGLARVDRQQRYSWVLTSHPRLRLVQGCFHRAVTALS